MKALRERQREELSKVESGGPRPPPRVVLGFLPTWRLERSDEILNRKFPPSQASEARASFRGVFHSDLSDFM